MPREKHHKKEHREDATKENGSKNEPSNSQLFSEADAKSVEASGYTLGYGAPQTDRLMHGHEMPTGVVGIDESVILPGSPSKSRHQHHESKPFNILQPSQNHYKEHVHLPPIADHSYHHYQHQPHGYFHTPSDYHHFGHLSHPYPVHHQHQSPHHHHHHHRHRHHHHETEVETYDPRWWYLPHNSVHAPKPWQPPDYHYVPLKWYESPSKQSKLSINSPESVLPSRKYVDCRCEVCRPSKETPRGTKWVVNE